MGPTCGWTVTWNIVNDNEKLKETLANSISNITDNINELEQKRKKYIEELIKIT